MAGLDGTITITNSEYRPCIVGDRKALFHRWVEKSKVVPPSMMVGGHPGGTVSGVVAIVEFEDGTVEEMYPYKIKFLDSKQLFSEMRFE